MKRIFFWIYIIISICVLILSFARSVLEVDLLQHNHWTANVIHYLQGLGTPIKIVLTVIWAVILIVLYRNFNAHLESR